MPSEAVREPSDTVREKTYVPVTRDDTVGLVIFLDENTAVDGPEDCDQEYERVLPSGSDELEPEREADAG